MEGKCNEEKISVCGLHFMQAGMVDAEFYDTMKQVGGDRLDYHWKKNRKGSYTSIRY